MSTDSQQTLTFDTYNLGNTTQTKKDSLMHMMRDMSPGVQVGAATDLLAAFHAGERITDKAASDLFAGFILFAHDADVKAGEDDVCIHHIASLSGEANKHIDSEMLMHMGPGFASAVAASA